MRNRSITLLTALALMVTLAPAALAGGRPLSAELLGSNEVSPGDPDGAGTALLTLNQGQNEVCFQLDVEDIGSPTRAHIHRGGPGVNGGIVVFFYDLVVDPPIPVTDEGCVGVDRDLIKEIRQSPEDFYVNVHNDEFPAGAIRGQLSK